MLLRRRARRRLHEPPAGRMSCLNDALTSTKHNVVCPGCYVVAQLCARLLRATITLFCAQGQHQPAAACTGVLGSLPAVRQHRRFQSGDRCSYDVRHRTDLYGRITQQRAGTASAAPRACRARGARTALQSAWCCNFCPSALRGGQRGAHLASATLAGRMLSSREGEGVQPGGSANLGARSGAMPARARARRAAPRGAAPLQPRILLLRPMLIPATARASACRAARRAAPQHGGSWPQTSDMPRAQHVAHQRVAQGHVRPAPS